MGSMKAWIAVLIFVAAFAVGVAGMSFLCQAGGPVCPAEDSCSIDYQDVTEKVPGSW